MATFRFNPNKKVEEVAPVETGVDSSKKEKEVAKDVKVTKKSAVTKTKKKWGEKLLCL